MFDITKNGLAIINCNIQCAERSQVPPSLVIKSESELELFYNFSEQILKTYIITCSHPPCSDVA